MVRQAVRDILVFAFLAGLALGYSSDANAELGDRVPLGNNESGHLILGTSKPYDRGGIEILRDAKIGNLRMRHVRAVNERQCGGLIQHHYCRFMALFLLRLNV